MMASPRQTIVSLDDTPTPCLQKVATVVRVWCVRLFSGIDNSTGENFEHHREWVDSRILELATIFAIDIWLMHSC